MKKKEIKGGLYLVIDPSQGIDALAPTIESALEGGVDVLQLWNRWHPQQDHESFINSVCEIARPYNVPVLINEAWEWLRSTPLDGVHFDKIPQDWNNLRQFIGRAFVAGITAGNNFDIITWAIEHQLDYISFCSMFPSASANACEIVSHDTIQRTRALTTMPIFVAGGITPENVSTLFDLGIDGIALISGIVKAKDPKQAAIAYKQIVSEKLTLKE